ncbi:MAG TPA: arylsulfatase [Phycisphaerae bacterium]|nr:arylsulfatase [Phycisphaerae bacterium]HQL73919.1 arylsulfatase [Phycisphaerae bacterium]
MIMADDMGFSDAGCYGGEIHTPTLDRLAAGGLRFTQCYNTARCCPTRASLMTGLYPHQAGMGHMTSDNKLPGYTGTLNRSCRTIPEVLRPAGYRTYMCGKWHVVRNDWCGQDGPKHNWPLQRGYDRFYGTIQGGGNFYDPVTLCRDNTFVSPDADSHYKPKTFYYTDAISDNAVAFLQDHARDNADKPFFMYVAYTSPHWPMHALPEDIAKYKGKYDAGYGPIRQKRLERARELGVINKEWELSPQAGDWDKQDHKQWEARCMEVFAAMIDRMDQGIGRIVAELDKQGRLGNTVIFFLQDNGGCAEGMGRVEPKNWDIPPREPFKPDELAKTIWPPMHTREGKPVRGGPGVMPGPADTYIGYGRNWANVSNTPFREYKHWVHEGGISTPLIVHWPAGLRRTGQLEHAPAHLIDIMATCVDLGQASYPKQVDGQDITPMEGVSLAPTFSGGKLGERAIFWEHEGNRAVRRGQWKLVAKGPRAPWELYDMQADRTELNDLSGRKPELAKELADQWEQWARRAHAVPWPWGLPYGKPKGEGKKKADGAAKKKAAKKD